MKDIIDQIAKIKVVPLVTFDSIDQVEPLCEALLNGGISLLEVAYRSPVATEAIQEAAQFPGITVGAGTILTKEQMKEAVGAGAQFILSPGFNPKLAKACNDKKIPFFPGVATPSEVTMALEAGLSTLKYFPAEAFGGPKAINAIAAAFPEIKFIPAGGISLSNLGEYLRIPSVIACSGSWMIDKSSLNKGYYNEITIQSLNTLEKITSLSD